MTALTLDALVEAMARSLCVADGYNPDQLEPGDALGFDGTCPNGDPGHFMWRQWDRRARAALAAQVAASGLNMRAAADLLTLAAEAAHHEETKRAVLAVAALLRALAEAAEGGT